LKEPLAEQSADRPKEALPVLTQNRFFSKEAKGHRNMSMDQSVLYITTEDQGVLIFEVEQVMVKVVKQGEKVAMSGKVFQKEK